MPRPGPATTPVAIAAVLTVLLALPAGAYVFEVTDAGVPILWPQLRASPPAPLVFSYHRAGSPALGGPLDTNAALRATLDRCLATWASVHTSTVRFASPPIIGRADLGDDLINLIVFTSSNPESFTGPDGPLIVGLTTTSFVTHTGVLVDADIQLNDTSSAFTLSLEGRTGSRDGSRGGVPVINVADVLTHELGHALGLDHGGLINTTMYFAATDGSSRLAADDQIGISIAYPASGFEASRGSIRGAVAGSIFGAHVVAVDAASGRPTAAALTGPDGRYRIAGLPPGSYAVLAEPLRPNALAGYYARLARDFPVSIHTTATLPVVSLVDVRAGRESPGIDIAPVAIPAVTHVSPSSAIRLGPGQGAAGLLPPSSSAHPHDHYVLSASRGSTLTVNAIAYQLWVPLDLGLELLDASLAPVAGRPATSGSGAPADLDEGIVVPIEVPGPADFYVRVTAREVDPAVFPDGRSIKTGSSLYLLTTARSRTNRRPAILDSASLSRITTHEDGPLHPSVVSIDLSRHATDVEDIPQALAWRVHPPATDLYGTDEAALAGVPPRLVIRPRPHRSGQGRLTLTLADTDGATDVLDVTLDVTPVNDPPGPLVRVQTAREADRPGLVALDATGSTPGPAGDLAEAVQPLAYSWRQTAGPPPARALGLDGPRPLLFVRAAGEYRFRLDLAEVAGAPALAGTTEVTLAVANLPPRADPGPHRVVVPGTMVLVMATHTSDANDALEELTLSLTELPANPAPAVVAGRGPGAFEVALPPVAGRYRFRLDAVDRGFVDVSGAARSRLTSSALLVLDAVDVRSPRPSAIVAPLQVVRAAEQVALDGRDSVGADGLPHPLVYRWSADAANPASVILPGAPTATAAFAAPPEPGLYGFDLVVEDPVAGLASDLARAEVLVLNPAAGHDAAPVASIGPILFSDVDSSGTLDPGEPVALDGSASRGIDGLPITYRWVQREGPAGALSAGGGATAVFAPSWPGRHVFALEVAQGRVRSLPASVDFTVGPDPGLRVSVVAGRLSTSGPVTADPENRFVSSGGPVPVALEARVSGGEPTYRIVWDQTEGPRVPVGAGSGPLEARLLLHAPRVHAFRAWVTDGRGATATAYTRLLVDRPPVRVPRARVGVPVVTGSWPSVDATLDGSASRDLDDEGRERVIPGLVYFWEQVEGPRVGLVGRLGPRPVFRPPLPGRYTFRLRVDNGNGGTMSAPAPDLAVDVGPGLSVPVSSDRSGPGPLVLPDGPGPGGCARAAARRPALSDLLVLVPMIVALRLRSVGRRRLGPRRGRRQAAGAGLGTHE